MQRCRCSGVPRPGAVLVGGILEGRRWRMETNCIASGENFPSVSCTRRTQQWNGSQWKKSVENDAHHCKGHQWKGEGRDQHGEREEEVENTFAEQEAREKSQIVELKDHLRAAPEEGWVLRETFKNGPTKLWGSEDKSDRGVDSEAGCIGAMRREDERVDQALFGSRPRSLRKCYRCRRAGPWTWSSRNEGVKIWTGVRVSHRWRNCQSGRGFFANADEGKQHEVHEDARRGGVAPPLTSREYAKQATWWCSMRTAAFLKNKMTGEINQLRTGVSQLHVRCLDPF